VSANRPHRRSSSFFIPMLMMGKKKRHALKALYYFCRAVDDAVDEAPSKQQARENLAFWQTELENIYTVQRPPENEIMRQLGLAIWQFKLPRQPFEDLLQGMEFDCSDPVEIQTEQELERYCYCVAGAVGLQAMRIFGLEGEQANAFAIALGQALQLTNILRDKRKDAAIKRSYIPKEWSEDKDSKLISKAKEGFEKVAELEQVLPSRPLLPALLMRDIYRWKLKRLQAKRAAKPLPFAFYLRLLAKAGRYYAKAS